MPGRKAIRDNFVQFMQLSVLQSAANTLTFNGVPFGNPMFQYSAMIIERIDYFVARATLDLMTATNDSISLAITGSNTITTLGVEQAEVYDTLQIAQNFFGFTPADHTTSYWPVVHDFSSMTGGGLLVPLQTVYLAMSSVGLASAGTGNVRLYYKLHDLKAEDYLELAQRLNVLST